MRAREQAGVTLLEVMVAIALAALIMTPTAAWVMSTVRHEQTAREVLDNTASSAFLASYFPQDVATARVVDTSPGDCLGGTGGAAGQVKGWIETAGVLGQRIVYTEAAPSGKPANSPERSLWRRVCDRTGHFVSASEIYDDVVPHSVHLDCLGLSASATAVPVDCATVAARQVRIRLTPSSGYTTRPELTMLGTRRVDVGSVGVGGGLGNRPPSARINASSTVGHLHTSFSFSGAASEDLDGTVVGYDWEFSDGTTATGMQVTHVFGSLGSQSAVLTASDDQGATSVAVVTVEVFNLYPVAIAEVAPETGTRGVTSFSFDAGQTADPDNAAEPLTYEWDLGADLGADHLRTTRTFSYTFPVTASGGLRIVTLKVTDSHGAVDTAILQIGLDRDPEELGTISISPSPVPVGTKVPRVGTVGASLPPLEVSFSTAGAEPGAAEDVGWKLTSIGSGAVVATGVGATFSHTFAATDAGSYRIVRIDPATQSPVGDGVDFRVNAAPVAAFTTTALGASQVAPQSFQFTGNGAGGSTDADGSIVAYRWDFGSYGQWISSDPRPIFEFPTPGDFPVTLTVTDDDGVSVTSAATVVSLTGTVAAPPAPTWQGQSVLLAVVPGATAYRVDMTCDGAPVASTVVAPSTAPTSTLAGGTCASTSVAVATVAVGVRGTFGPSSAPAVRP